MNNSLRQYYLEAIGVQSWQLKSVPNYSEQDVLAEQTYPDRVNEPVEVSQVVDKIQLGELTVGQSGHDITVSNNALDSLTTTFEPETDNDKESNFVQPVSDIIDDKSIEVESVESKEVSSISLSANTIELVSELDQSIINCKQCSSRQNRLNALSGQGNSNASIFIISEAPTAEEDRSGQYLNEQSLLLLEAMFHSIDFKDDYYYTGIIKCYSFSDYLYSESEVTQCTPFLYTQIEQTQPSVLVIFGAIQAQTILQSKKSFNELRGKIHHVTINNIEYPVIVTYHPAYLLRNPLYKREALNDLIMIKKLCNE